MSSCHQHCLVLLFALFLWARPAGAVLRYDFDLRAHAQIASSVVRANVTGRVPLDPYHERLQLMVTKVFSGPLSVGSTVEVTSYKTTEQQRLPSSAPNDAEVIGFIVLEGEKTHRFGPFRVMSTLASINNAVERDVETAVMRAAQVKASLANDAPDAELLALVIETDDLDATWNHVPRDEFGFNMGGYEDVIAEDILDRLIERKHFANAMRLLLRSPAIVETNTKLQWQQKALIQFASDTSNPLELRVCALKTAERVAGPERGTVPQIEPLLKDKSEDIRVQAVGVLNRLSSWTPEDPVVIRRARAQAVSLWQSEKSGRVRLGLLQATSLRRLVSLPDDGQVYSSAALGRRGTVMLHWGSVVPERAVRVREARLRDRLSNRVVQVLRHEGDGVEEEREFSARIALDTTMDGSTVDLTLEGVLESALHAPTSFSIPLGTHTVEAFWIKALPTLVPTSTVHRLEPDAGTSARPDAGAVTSLQTPTQAGHAPAIVLGVVVLFVLLLGWAARAPNAK